MPTRAPQTALTSGSLYARVLGERYEALPPLLRSFHAHATGGRADGALRVRHGRGLLARLAAWTIGAPPPGEAVPVELRVELDATGERERWVRRFGPRTMVTHQWRSGTQLIEAVSLTRLYFELVVDEAAQAMIFEQRRCELLRMPLPTFLSPRIECRASCASSAEGAWTIHVAIHLPLIGLICEYSGDMFARTEPAATPTPER